MYFKNHENNERLIKRLEAIVRNGMVSHAYIFEASSSIDKRSFAESFVKGILCGKSLGENCMECSICSKIDHENHEDIIYIAAGGNSIKDADIIAMQDRLKIKPFGTRNIVIMENSDTMTLRAQNRLLKTLEEPPGNSVIILLSENMENLTQTVRSRCVKFRINYFGSDGYDFMMDKAALVADMALKREAFYRMKAELSDVLGAKEDVAAFLDCLQLVYRNMIIENKNKISVYREQDIMDHIHSVELARKQIKDGVSAANAMKNLLLKMGG